MYEFKLKLALTLRSLVMLTVVLLADVSDTPVPLHPVKEYPASGVAVMLALVPYP